MRGSLSIIRVKNFKAVADSGQLKLGPLSVFIGNNGTGKSSIVEALQTLQRLVLTDIDEAMRPFKGLEHVRHKRSAVPQGRQAGNDVSRAFHPMEFVLRGRLQRGSEGNVSRTRFRSETHINEETSGNRYLIPVDDVRENVDTVPKPERPRPPKEPGIAGRLRAELGPFIRRWQFLSLDPSFMGEPIPSHRGSEPLLLHPSGSNLADYIWHIDRHYRDAGVLALRGIRETIKFVLPYAASMDSQLTTEIQRQAWLTMTEASASKIRKPFTIPGWMLSTGTMRVLALLAVFRHPEPPPLICIEEIENGLDPRTLRLVANEIQTLVESKRSQVILTTHSPYLLDLLPLSSIVMTQRTPKGVTFTRPERDQNVREWAKDFAPGQLYMMGRFRTRGGTD